MTKEELILVALSGMPLGIAELKHYTGIPEYDLWVALADLKERGLVTEYPRPLGPDRPPVRFMRR